jgi:hypothetical protein
MGSGKSNLGINLGNLLMAIGAAAILGAALFSPGTLRIIEFSGVIAAGAGFFFHKLFA